jgi:hypothetical protein
MGPVTSIPVVRLGGVAARLPREAANLKVQKSDAGVTVSALDARGEVLAADESVMTAIQTTLAEVPAIRDASTKEALDDAFVGGVLDSLAARVEE